MPSKFAEAERVNGLETKVNCEDPRERESGKTHVISGEVQESMERFLSAWADLNEKWEDALDDAYPFDVSFDELYGEVSNWLDYVKQKRWNENVVEQAQKQIDLFRKGRGLVFYVFSFSLEGERSLFCCSSLRWESLKEDIRKGEFAFDELRLEYITLSRNRARELATEF